MIDGTVFVTPHAVERFRERIAALAYDDARAAILDGLTRIAGAPANGVVRVRRGPFAFRARIGPPPGPGLAPVVVTILRSGR